MHPSATLHPSLSHPPSSALVSTTRLPLPLTSFPAAASDGSLSSAATSDPALSMPLGGKGKGDEEHDEM